MQQDVLQRVVSGAVSTALSELREGGTLPSRPHRPQRQLQTWSSDEEDQSNKRKRRYSEVQSYVGEDSVQGVEHVMSREQNLVLSRGIGLKGRFCPGAK